MPAHVNQFTAAGLFPNGTSSARYDCTVAVGMMALDDFTGGAIRPTATEFRRRQRDQAGGIGLNDVAVVWKSYGLPAFTSGSKGWGTIMERLRAGRPVAMQGWSGALGRFAVGKPVAHAIYATRATPGGMIVIHDPLRNAAITIPEADVQRFYFSGFALAGWGTGTYAGRPATSPTSAPVAGVSASTAASAKLEQVFASLGLTDPAHVITRDEALAIVRALGTPGGYQPQLAAAYQGRTVRQMLDAAAGNLIAPLIDLAPLGEALGNASFVIVIGGLIVILFVLGAWRLTSK